MHNAKISADTFKNRHFPLPCVPHLCPPGVCVCVWDFVCFEQRQAQQQKEELFGELQREVDRLKNGRQEMQKKVIECFVY